MHPTPDDLRRIVDAVDLATAEEGFNLRPTLLRITTADDCPEGFALGFLDLDGRSVTDAILGLRAEPDWAAVGHVTGAWVAPTETWNGAETERGRFPVRPSSHPDSVRARCIVLMGRDGTVVGSVRMADQRVVDDPPTEGLALDGMRRVFGLATRAATFPTSELLNSMWMSEVIAAARDARRSAGLSVRAVVRLHPAMRMLEAGGQRVDGDQFVEAASALARVLTWTRVREQAQRGWFGQIVSPELAAWMDEGMLARWLVGGFPPLDALVHDACSALRPPVARALRDALRALGGLSASVA